MVTTLAWGMPGLPEWIIIGAIGLLLFGKRLPEVGRSLGKGIVEFKKGLKGIEDDIDEGVTRSHEPSRPRCRRTISSTRRLGCRSIVSRNKQSSRDTKPAYKFDPYTGQPISNS